MLINDLSLISLYFRIKTPRYKAVKPDGAMQRLKISKNVGSFPITTMFFTRKMDLPFSSIGITGAFGFITVSNSHFLLNVCYICHGSMP